MDEHGSSPDTPSLGQEVSEWLHHASVVCDVARATVRCRARPCPALTWFGILAAAPAGTWTRCTVFCDREMRAGGEPRAWEGVPASQVAAMLEYRDCVHGTGLQADELRALVDHEQHCASSGAVWVMARLLHSLLWFGGRRHVAASPPHPHQVKILRSAAARAVRCIEFLLRRTDLSHEKGADRIRLTGSLDAALRLSTLHGLCGHWNSDGYSCIRVCPSGSLCAHHKGTRTRSRKLLSEPLMRHGLRDLVSLVLDYVS